MTARGVKKRLAGQQKYIIGPTLLLVCIVADAQGLPVQWSKDPETLVWASTYATLYGTNWQDGLGAQVGVQANPGDITTVDDPRGAGRKVVRASIKLTEDFSHVANGAPRAELLFPVPVRFAQISDYLIRWSTYLPSDFAFDSQQQIIITQIHQGPVSGTPPIALALLGKNYKISERGVLGSGNVGSLDGLCCADADTGRWVNWALRYVADGTGQHALAELYKDGKLVFATRGAPNAYPGDQSAYLKIGLYKPAWTSQPTDVSQSTIYFGPLQVSQR
jgi:hypothetical protein